MKRKKFETPTGRLSEWTQPSKERYQQILAERNRRALELGATPNKRKKYRGIPYDDLKENIQDNVVVEPVSGCWIWLKNLQNIGYGLIEVPRTAADGQGPASRGPFRKNTKTRTVHRVAYEEFVGPIPKGLVVAHTCDCTYCVNPEHLWLATRKENTQDMIAKGRDNFGFNAGWSVGLKRFTKDGEFEYFAPGTEPKGWKMTNPRDSRTEYYAGLYAAKKAALVLISQVQANSQPHLV